MVMMVMMMGMVPARRVGVLHDQCIATYTDETVTTRVGVGVFVHAKLFDAVADQCIAAQSCDITAGYQHISIPIQIERTLSTAPGPQ